MSVLIPIYRLPHAPQDLPAYATPLAAGMDLRAAITDPIRLSPMQRELIPTGFVIALPEGYEAQIRPRSGLSIKHGITLINAVGTIDADYRHEVKIPVVNLGTADYVITPGERLAQLIVAPVLAAAWQVVADEASLPAPTAGGRTGGFGSTGRQ